MHEEEDGERNSADATARPVAPPVIETVRLFAGTSEVRLKHRGEEYRLRITRQGKLILTK